MNIEDTLRKIPSSTTIMIVGLVIVAGWLITAKGWIPETQWITFGLFFLIVVMSIQGHEKGLMEIEEAENIAWLEIIRLKSNGIIQCGTSMKLFDAVLQQRDGEPFSWDVCMTAGSPPMYHVLSIHPFDRYIMKRQIFSKWDSSMSPDVEFIVPPRVKEYEKRIEHLDADIEKKRRLV